MVSRDNFPRQFPQNDEDSKKKKNFDKYHRGNGRRNYFNTRRELREDSSFIRTSNKYAINDRSFDDHRTFRNDQEESSFTRGPNKYVTNDRSFVDHRTFRNDQEESSFTRGPNKYVTNDRSFDDHRSFRNDRKENQNSSWRKSTNIESTINQRESLVTQIYQCQYECMICFVNIELDAAIWSCESCYHLFHINCIKKWSRTCGNENDNTGWRCPACQKEYSMFCQDLLYSCFCGKVNNPVYNRENIPHSCGTVCGKGSKNNPRCPHLCSILCHPGPCPVCEASIKCNCYCGRTEFIVKCSTTGNHLSCGEKCNKMLNCSVHICQVICHVNDCDPCKEIVTQKCCCEKEIREVMCGSLESYQSCFTCNNICNRTKDCDFHKCEKKCHPGQCEPCNRLPENMLYCACGKTPLKDFLGLESSLIDRKSCIDPIPTCDEICNKPYHYCDHKCCSVCHENDCLPCDLTSNVKCRCNKSSRNIKCAEVARIFSMGEVIKCTIRCKSKKTCGIHRCQDICCDIQVHVCTLTCSKMLSCKKHYCERPCHRGDCPKCDNVSFEELYCKCGRTNLLPPIACGQDLPFCRFPCSREHLCDHEMVHNCHNEVQCPPCTVLTSKECPGGHKMLYNIPCFRPVVTCGLICNKPLPNCSHLCNRTCHEGNCTDDLFVCTQLCSKPRVDCGHACNLPCHTDNCTLNMKPCGYVMELRCSCRTRSINVSCEKLDKVNTMLKCNGATNKRDALDFCISENGNSVSLLCNNDCKKAVRSKQLSEAFESESFTFEHVAFSSFLREFSIKNPDFLIQIDSVLCNLIKKLDIEKSRKCIHRFTAINREKRRFIQELSEHFVLSVNSTDLNIIYVEAIKGMCKIPNHRLIHFIQKNYPSLFKTDKPTSLKNVKIQNNDFSLTDRLNLLNLPRKS